MEIKITTNQILKVLQVYSWIVFIGLCIQTGDIIVNTFITLVINPRNVEYFWEGGDYLSTLYKFDRGHFFAITLMMAIVAVLKAIMFYLIVRLFVDKKLNMAQPFNVELRRFILRISYLSLGIALFSDWAVKYSVWLTKQGVKMPELRSLHIEGADVWFFTTIILFVIVQIVKRGIEIQNENDLTI